MRYLISAFLAATMAVIGCEREVPKPSKSQEVREMFVSGKKGKVHFWQVNGKTDYIEISWSEKDEECSKTYTLSANGGRTFYDIGEVEARYRADPEKVRKSILDAESRGAFLELRDLSRKANRIRKSVLAENNIPDTSIDPPPYSAIGWNE